MNAIEKKHLTVHDSVPYNQPKSSEHATITKDTAVGFAEWMVSDGWVQDKDASIWKNTMNHKLPADYRITTQNIYDIYVKSLEG